MLKTMHSFVFSKLRLTTNRNHSALKEYCTDLELKIANLEAHFAELEQKIISQEAHYSQLQGLQDEKITTLDKHCAELARQYRSLQPDAPRLSFPLSFEEQLNQLKKLEPNAFDLWWSCFLNGEKEYNRAAESHLSCGTHPGAAKFHTFITPLLQGNVLDIGCGPQPFPSYLNNAIDKGEITVFGIDPLFADHPFNFYQGFAEFLPWQANCFDVVICATSLDHCLNLSRTLEEINRVLKPGGKLLTWVGFIPGSKAYDPKSAELVAVDDYHLFHFDRPWFESLMTTYFKRVDSIHYDDLGSFYVFEA